MLSLFPELLDYGVLGVLVVRLAAGISFLVLAQRALGSIRPADTGEDSRTRHVVGYLYGTAMLAVGALLVAGLFTQGAALGGLFLATLSLVSGMREWSDVHERHVYALLAVLCVALMFLGAGPFAYDLPL